MEQRFNPPKSNPLPDKKLADDASVPSASLPEERPLITDLANFFRGTRTLLPMAVLGIFLMGFVAFLYWAKPFLLPFFLALVLSFMLRPVVKFLARLRLSELWATILVMGGFLLILGIVVSHLIQPATEWAARAPESLRQVEGKLRALIRPANQLSRAAESVQNMAGETSEVSPTPKVEIRSNNLPKVAFDFASGFVMTSVETVVLLFFFLALGDMFTAKLIKILPTLGNKKKALEITSEVQHNISVFLFTITALNVGFGFLVGFSLMLLGMPNPLLWGVIAALLNFIPYFGPLTGVVILGIAGLVTFDSVGRALLPPLVYLGIHGIEANLLTPLLLGRRLTMNPVVIFLALMFWMWLWGVPGALLSVPVLMMFKVFCDHFKPLAPIGEFISGPERTERKMGYHDYMRLLEERKEAGK